MQLHLAEHGQAVYDALVSGRDVSAAQMAMALNAARTVDTLDKIELELALNPALTVVNTQGTRTANPLISEARMLRGALSQILSKMGVSALPEREQTEKSRVDQLAERRAQRQANRASNS